MEEIEVDKARMDALRSLSDTNMAISHARESLQTLEKNETEYLLEREKKVVLRVENAFKDSSALIEQTVKNYEMVKDFAGVVIQSSEQIQKAIGSIKEHSKLHDERTAAWEARCTQQEEDVANEKKVIQSQVILLNSEKEGIEAAKRLLVAHERKLTDERGTLERAIKRLREGRI